MNIKPLYDRVVIKRMEEEKLSAGGIVIPSTTPGWEEPGTGERPGCPAEEQAVSAEIAEIAAITEIVRRTTQRIPARCAWSAVSQLADGGDRART